MRASAYHAVSALVEFDVASAAHPAVLSLGRFISKGFAFSPGEHESHMAKDGVRAKLYPKGKTVMLRVR